jgi:glycosyltransferase involved in cell wall biosynthesis
MKVLVFAHQLDLGGTQVNAIELTAALRDQYGHDIVMFATPGPSVDLAHERKIRLVPAPGAHHHPSLARMRALMDVVRREKPDLIHAWDWPQCLDSYYGAHLVQRVPLVVSDMSMQLNRILPKTVPTTFGTPQIVAKAKAAGRMMVDLLLPPVDVHANAPGVVSGTEFRKRYGIEPDEIVLVTVSRLTQWMKAESLRRTLDVVRRIGNSRPLRLVIVGDGNARPALDLLASETNAELGRPAAILTGALTDPRPAYAAADIVLGMGGSALRGMAFGKPVVIVGEGGFSAVFNAESADAFYYHGIYGLGTGQSDNTNLRRQISALIEVPGRLSELGEFSREFVLKHFALDALAARLNRFFQSALSERPNLLVSAADGSRTLAVLLAGKMRSAVKADAEV